MIITSLKTYQIETKEKGRNIIDPRDIKSEGFTIHSPRVRQDLL